MTDLPALYAGARALVFPSLDEGFGLPVVEAFACGTPVLASTAGALPETAGGAALLVDPEDVDAIADGVRRLLEDGALRADLAARGRARAASLTWEACARATRWMCSRVRSRVSRSKRASWRLTRRSTRRAGTRPFARASSARMMRSRRAHRCACASPWVRLAWRSRCP